MRIMRQRPAVIAALVLIPVVMAFPWASVEPLENTHQYVVDVALNRLKADPAFEWKFPTFGAIRDHEGVKVTEAGLIGMGADAHGRSTYSEHYYNPVTNEGSAPTSVARYYSVLIRDNLLIPKSTSEAGPKAAAYCAHFLADIFVPYHVNGTSRANAEKIWRDQNAGNFLPSDVKSRVPVTRPLVPLITLPETIAGLKVLSYLTPLSDDANFYTQLSRFLVMTEPPEFDWFDPWYYNGSTDVAGLYYVHSSHILWEGRPTGQVGAVAFHQQVGQGLTGYDPKWKNGAPTFDSPWGPQSEEARKFAVLKASETRTLQTTYFNQPTLALSNTIRAVYTLWRGSISGLRPVIEYQPDGAAYRVTGKVTNAASAAASNPRARLTATDCTVSDAKEKSLGASLAATKKQEVSAAWKVQPITGKTCKLKLEVVAAYSIPDIQYAAVERTFFPEHVEQVKPKPAELVPGCTNPNFAACNPHPQPAAPVDTKTTGKVVAGKWRCTNVGVRACSCIYPPEPWTPGCAAGDKSPSCKDNGVSCGSISVENANKIWQEKQAGKYSGWGEPGNR